MPSFGDILASVKTSKDKFAVDTIRKQYLKQLSSYTNRYTIAYYSAWLQTTHGLYVGINDLDKHAFMSVIFGMKDREKRGLDLILHTPGGQVSATESLIDYLHSIFGTNIRAIIPQMAMSGGTMLACACKEIVMGKHSNLGPIDPQLGGIPAGGVIDEFDEAIKHAKENPSSIPIWQTLINKYPPSFIGMCRQAIDWSEEIAKTALRNCMFKESPNAEEMANNVTQYLSSHRETKAHDRHISIAQCKKIGMNIVELEKNNKFQDLVLSVHHCFMITFAKNHRLCKIVENQDGAYMTNYMDMPNKAD
ncbi:MAG: hypothetical protein LBH45_07275 [Campylobacteraceae bacterium]|jgi:ATP-dependent protease ClpP protease subunit|nr:hypothetical protein [Campylobacteraceae bacterium]